MNKQLLKSIIFICAYTSIGIGINYNGEYNYSKKTLDEYRIDSCSLLNCVTS